MLLFIRLNSLGIFLEIMKKKSDSEINRITKQKGNKIIIVFFLYFSISFSKSKDTDVLSLFKNIGEIKP